MGRSGYQPSLISAQWINMAPLIALALIVASLVSWSLPPLEAIAYGSVAISVTLLAPLLRAFEKSQGRHFALRFIAMLIAVPLPMFAFGHAIAVWGMDHGLAWQISLGTLVVVTSLASVI